MAAKFGIEAMIWPWSGTHALRHDARQLVEVDLVRAMRKHADAVGDIHALYHATVVGAGSWTVDTRVPGGRVSVGLTGTPDCTVWMTQDTFDSLFDHELSPQWAVITGRLRVSNIGLAKRLANILLNSSYMSPET